MTSRDGRPFEPGPVVLSGRAVRLEPLEPRHARDLFEAGRDSDLWAYLPRPAPETPSDMSDWIEEALAAQERGEEVPFALVDPASGRAIGSTRIGDIRRPHRGIEIGYTWIGRDHQRTAVNTEAKLLLLSHAFDDLGAVRVQLKTHRRNVTSQRAIARIGAVREGVLRRHMCVWDGHVRDTVMYSVVSEDWPAVRRRLETLLESGARKRR